MANISEMFERITQFISEAVARIFSPTDDEYPPTGVQPFEGEPYEKTKSSD